MPDRSVNRARGANRWARALAPLLLAALVLALLAPGAARAATAPSLGMAASFAVLGGSTVTNTGATTISGDVGVSPGTSITGFPPGVVVNGSLHANDVLAAQAQADLALAYANLAGQAADTTLSGQDLGGLTLTPGVYHFAASATLAGTLTLDAQGDPDAVFVIQVGTTLTTATGAAVTLINGASQHNVFWQVGSSATLGVGTAFRGSILAFTSIVLNPGASVAGRALAINGAVTLDSVAVAVNTAPVAMADAHAAAEDTPLTVGVPGGVLANDTDADGDPLTAAVVASPTHGTLTLNADGSFTYTPNADYSGPDGFTYAANDGTANSNTVTVTLTVAPVNDAPVAVADGYATAEGSALTIAAPGVLANDTDAEGGPLTAVLATGPAHGTLTLNADGAFTYTPSAGYAGSDGFTYRASDGTATSGMAMVSLTIVGTNAAPVAHADAYGTTQDAPLVVSAPGVLANDTDADGDPLTAVLVSGPAHGTLALQADGAFTYTPAQGFSGADSFTYKASDGTAQSAVATVTIQVGGTATLTLSASGPGTVAANPAAPTQPVGTVVTLTPAAQGGALFVGWTVDGQPAGWATPLTITLDRDHTVVARFAAPVAFSDLAPTDPAASAIRELTARGIVNGYGDGRFGPADTLNRAQAAALVVRGLDWSGERYATPFTDQRPVDDELWRSVGILAHYGAARGFGDGTYHPVEAVDHAQFISLVTRAMVAKGYWVQQPDDAARFPAVGASGHRQDLLTYQHYVGGFPDLTEASDAAAWFGPASRGWSVRALWAALDQYQRADRTP